MGKKKGKRKASSKSNSKKSNSSPAATITNSNDYPGHELAVDDTILPAAVSNPSIEQTNDINNASSSTDENTSSNDDNETIENETTNGTATEEETTLQKITSPLEENKSANDDTESIQNETTNTTTIDEEVPKTTGKKVSTSPSLEEKLSDPDETWEDAQENIDEEPMSESLPDPEGKGEEEDDEPVVEIVEESLVVHEETPEEKTIDFVETDGNDNGDTDHNITSPAVDIAAEPQIPAEKAVPVEIHSPRGSRKEIVQGETLADKFDEELHGVRDGDGDDETATTYVDEMPLFHYSRIVSAGLPQGEGADLPRSTCSQLVAIRVDPEELTRAGANNTTTIDSTTGTDDHASVTTVSSAAAAARQHQKEQNLLLSSDLWRQPHLIVASGHDSGTKGITFTRIQRTPNESSSSPCVVFATTAEIGGASKYSSVSTELLIRDGSSNNETAIVDMSFDSSGSVFGAIDGGGNCAIWEFKYTTSLQSSALVFGNDTSSSSSATTNTAISTTATRTPPVSPARQTGGIFSNFMSALTGIPPPDERMASGSSHGIHSNNNSRHGTAPVPNIATAPLVPTLTAEISQPSRVNYPPKWGPPTCMVLDPAYKIRREKSMLVGFANGQLYLTKKGTFFQRRNDTILYQAPASRSSDSYRGIESIVWRGPLVAFADTTGIKLMDMDHLTRIAHIDRPAGANPSLYPSILNVSPTLYFETSQHLLVGWGDCLMQIFVQEDDTDESSSAANSGDPVKKRRTVACTMAWELDCVACDLSPLDEDNIAVLGLVSLSEEDGLSYQAQDLELQILSRSDGTISYSDSLPLIQDSLQPNPYAERPLISARDFRLLSSFALPRMEDAEETRALRALKGANDMGFIGIDVDFDLNQPLFADPDSFTKKSIEYKDPHLRWKIESIVYDDDSDEIDPANGSSDDNSSVDSDDYECILRPMETIQPLSASYTNGGTLAPSPTMVICTDTDAILSLTSTIDDAIENSLDNHKCAQALSRGLCHKRQLRRYSLNELINYYLKAVLRIPLGSDQEESQPELSLRRMQLAVKAMPVLLGDRIELWEKWSKELEAIPGSLFLLKSYLPVRDPILPSTLYAGILERMLVEVEELSHASNRKNVSSIGSYNMYTEASNHFLESLLAWGPTKVLKDFISFYKYNRDRRRDEKASFDKDIRSTEISLQRRYLQTAAGYLIFPVRDIEEELEVSAPKYEVHNVDTEDSMFAISSMIGLLASRVPLVVSPGDFVESGAVQPPKRIALNNHTCLEAMARLRMMQGKYDLALKCYLAIGACHSNEPLQYFEKMAVDIVNGNNSVLDDPPSLIGDRSYEFVMSLIETHELNQFLFEQDFLMDTDSKLFMPIFALIRLVGLRRVGDFLMEHCVAAGFSYTTNTLEELDDAESLEGLVGKPKEILRRGSLPIDKVAEQLEHSPAILHWYLHLVFTRRPDFYIQFPTNYIPSKAVTSLHRRHFQLYVDFAGDARDSSKVLAGMEAYKVESKTTPLLIFLKAALPLGGMIPIDARRVLEIERDKDVSGGDAGDDDNSSGRERLSTPVFALELAYIIETYSEQTEIEARGVLNLYLKGARSLPLSVSYAQRQKQFSSMLWDHLISHCLKEASDGRLFGEMLEAAALSGADLARLVEQIPPGMIVEGLRPRLVAAVADYRMKLEIYEAAMAAGSEEVVSLMREIAQRVRRGVRYDLETKKQKSFAELIHEKARTDEIGLREAMRGSGGSGDESTASRQKLSKTNPRSDHTRLMYSLPRR